MKLTDIPVSTKIYISIVTPVKNMDVSTTVEELSDYAVKTLKKTFDGKNINYLPMELIAEDGKAVGFPAKDGYSYSLGCAIGDKYYSWNRIVIKNVKLADGHECHLALSNQDAPSLNRRNAYRLWIGNEISLVIGLSNNSQRGILKDLSATGMGIIVTDEDQYAKDKLLHVVYTDEDETQFKLTGRVVHVIEISAGKYLVGCQFFNRSDVIDKYVNQKQIERMRNKNSTKKH